MMIAAMLALSAGLIAGHWSHTVGAGPMLGGLVCAAGCLRRRDVAVVGLGAMVLRELLIGLSGFTPVRLAAMLAAVGVLRLVRVRPSFTSFAIGLGCSTPAYHLVLTVGDWVTQTCSKAPLTFQGLLETLTSSLPYVGRSLMTDALLAGAFLLLYAGAGALMIRRWPSLLHRPALLSTDR